MKKLLFSFLAVSVIFSACEKEEEEPINNNSELAIGDTHQGGIIFYLDSNGGGLISALDDLEGTYIWGCFGTDILGADKNAIGTGAQNTIDIEAGCATSGTAADVCSNLTHEGFSDWFLPSRLELNQMYLNIGQGNALGLENVGGFGNFNYWTSTEDGNERAWYQYFLLGNQANDGLKNQYLNVRPVRAF